MARIHAERLGGHARLLAVWSPEAPADPGSPADFMDQWPELEHLSPIDLDDIRAAHRERQRQSGRRPFSAASTRPAIGLRPACGAGDPACRHARPTPRSATSRCRCSGIFRPRCSRWWRSRAKPPILDQHLGRRRACRPLPRPRSTSPTMRWPWSKPSLQALDPEPFGLASRPRFRVALHAGPGLCRPHPLTGPQHGLRPPPRQPGGAHRNRRGARRGLCLAAFSPAPLLSGRDGLSSA